MPIRHLVMWTLRDRSDGPRFQSELQSCAGLVPGMLHFHVVLRDPTLEGNMDVALDSTFADAAALAAYQAHPHHRAVSARIGPLRAARHVLDFRVDDPADPPADAPPIQEA
jgi:hypothetical protein